MAVGLKCYLRNVKLNLGRVLRKQNILQEQYSISVYCKVYSKCSIEQIFVLEMQ